jgi:8-oxo-dGTP diphosphatase
MSPIASAYLILIRANQAFLMKRQNTGYEDGKYGVIAGHVEVGESFTDAMIREAREEAGIELTPDDISFSLLLNRYAHTSDPPERVDVFFTVSSDKVFEPCNQEPEECAEICWAPLDNLPDNCIPFIKYAIEQVRQRKSYAEYGWEAEETTKCQIY